MQTAHSLTFCKRRLSSNNQAPAVLCSDSGLTRVWCCAQYSIGPSTAHMHETHRYRVCGGGAALVYEISAVALDVPYGNRFSVETRFDVTATEVHVIAHPPSGGAKRRGL